MLPSQGCRQVWVWGEIYATTIFSAFFYVYSVCTQLNCSSKNFILFFFQNLQKKKMKFVHDLSKFTHMYVKQALTLSSEFSVNYHLANVGSACTF